MRVEYTRPKKAKWLAFRRLAPPAPKETAMNKDIILAVDYHDENLEIRRFNTATGEER